MPLLSVVKAAFPWLSVLLVFLVVITYFPKISTILPDTIMGPQEKINLKR
jgi:C4-dicarboxylate transporter DctM subunit